MSKNNLKSQNLLLLISSYFFMPFGIGGFLFLLLFSTFLDYASGLKISQYNKNLILKKLWFCFSVIVNLGFLCIFKYYNFFATSFVIFFQILVYT